MNSQFSNFSGAWRDWKTDCWAPPPDLLIQKAWGRALGFAFLPSSQARLTLGSRNHSSKATSKPLPGSWFWGVRKHSLPKALATGKESF